jgi:hypothetical protein
VQPLHFGAGLLVGPFFPQRQGLFCEGGQICFVEFGLSFWHSFLCLFLILFWWGNIKEGFVVIYIFLCWFSVFFRSVVCV